MMQVNIQQVNALAQHLSQKLNKKISDIQSVSGGDICASYRLTSEHGDRWFLKANVAEYTNMFQQERYNIHTIMQTCTITIPKPIDNGRFSQLSYLLLEYADMQTEGNEQKMGLQLARLHQYEPDKRCTNDGPAHDNYGFKYDNYIGSTHQKNSWLKSWSQFWIECRIKPQLELSYIKGFTQLKPFEDPLLESLHKILEQHQPKPSLVHGDLWGGNKAYTRSGEPIVFDPACYYGDRETDIAMTELFGGFGQGFYLAYNDVYPLKEGYNQRKVIYNLYHQLNHLNLFGAPYLNCCSQAIKQIIAKKKGN